MNAATIIVLAVVIALVAFALYTATRKGGSNCSCGDCSKKEGCPYCDGKGGKCD